MEIKFRGHYLTVEITYFVSPYPAKTNCYPDDGYEGCDGELEYDIISGNDLLDELLIEDYAEEIDVCVHEALENERDNY